MCYSDFQKKFSPFGLELVSTSASPPFQLEGAAPPLLYHRIGVRCAHTRSGKPRFPSTHPTEALRLRLRAAFGVSCAHSSLRQQALACYYATASPPLRAARPRNRNVVRRWAQSRDRIHLFAPHSETLSRTLPRNLRFLWIPPSEGNCLSITPRSVYLPKRVIEISSGKYQQNEMHFTGWSNKNF